MASCASRELRVAYSCDARAWPHRRRRAVRRAVLDGFAEEAPGARLKESVTTGN